MAGVAPTTMPRRRWSIRYPGRPVPCGLCDNNCCIWRKSGTTRLSVSFATATAGTRATIAELSALNRRTTASTGTRPVSGFGLLALSVFPRGLMLASCSCGPSHFSSMPRNSRSADTGISVRRPFRTTRNLPDFISAQRKRGDKSELAAACATEIVSWIVLSMFAFFCVTDLLSEAVTGLSLVVDMGCVQC